MDIIIKFNHIKVIQCPVKRVKIIKIIKIDKIIYFFLLKIAKTIPLQKDLLKEVYLLLLFLILMI